MPAVLPLVFLLACTSPTVGGLVGEGDSAVGDSAAADSADSDVRDTGVETIPGAWEPPVYDIYGLPEGMPTVNIVIDAEAMARLDEDPYHAPDERGVFVDGDGVTHEVDLCYRGAYALLSVMSYYDLRNWKVKFDSDDRYLGRREWNFNYEPHFSQKLAYDLFRFAGLAVPGAQHVVLLVNGEYQGMYLQYEDPDNVCWLWDELGDDEGDLYKAAYDLPYETQYFADLTYLGPDDEDYLLHYNKKTNQDGDYAVVRRFIEELNELDEDEVTAWYEANVDLERLRSYLAVSNFIANWDSYPQRSKNYWLYQDLRTQRMVYVPWDLDATFSPYIDGSYNQMGTSASVLYNLEQQDYVPPNSPPETEHRPLVRRLMALQEQRELYLERYRELGEEILTAKYLDARLSALTAIVEGEISATDRSRLESANATLRSFIQGRSAAVHVELEGLH